mmetsp:Transcript_21920/g.61270  ORF Transcript_21920/g.61270 Transcript_21920/m.61270 type:complete len:106 (+) Transcript_21920:75-392(+)
MEAARVRILQSKGDQQRIDMELAKLESTSHPSSWCSSNSCTKMRLSTVRSIHLASGGHDGRRVSAAVTDARMVFDTSPSSPRDWRRNESLDPRVNIEQSAEHKKH